VIGRGWGQGAQHSKSLFSNFTHIPGLKVIAPTTPYDMKGMLTAAIRASVQRAMEAPIPAPDRLHAGVFHEKA